MAKIQVVGDSIVITAGAKLDDLKQIAKYRPEALVLKGGEDNKSVVFKVTANTEKAGCVSANGINFNSEARDGSGAASVTLPYTGKTADVEGYIEDNFGKALMNLAKVEEQLPAAASAITADREAVKAMITIG